MRTTYFEQIPVEEVPNIIEVGGPTLKPIEVVPCPTCGAKPGEKCKLITGQPRTHPHRDRRLTAQDLLSS